MSKLQETIEKQIRPVLQGHSGDLELVEVTADGYVKVRLTGACAACPGAQQTIREVIETALQETCPEIKGVIPVSEVSQGLIDEALTILRRNKREHEGQH